MKTRRQADFQNLKAQSLTGLVYSKESHNVCRTWDPEEETPLDKASTEGFRSLLLGNRGRNSQHTPNRTEGNNEKVWQNTVPVPPSDAEYS